MDLSDENFTELTSQKDKIYLLDFWATWCGPCRMLAPVLEQIEAEYPEICFCKINVDEQPRLAGQFGIVSIPTLIFLKNGEVIKKSIGYLDADSLRAVIDGVI